jgi:dTDP-D-glucose 4,6-dehydratase
MLIQFVITWDDIAANAALTSKTPITVLRDVNLYEGPYRARITGFNWLDNLSDGIAAVNQDIININSSKFNFSASSNQGLFFTNRNEHVNPSIRGHLPFVINNIVGNLDLVISVQQFNADRTKNNNATWNNTGFIAMILTLDIEKCEEEKTQNNNSGKY